MNLNREIPRVWYEKLRNSNQRNFSKSSLFSRSSLFSFHEILGHFPHATRSIHSDDWAANFAWKLKLLGSWVDGVASRSKKPGGTRDFFQLSGVKMIQCAAASFQSSQRAVYCLLPATCILLLRSLDKNNSLWYIVIGRGGDVWECRLGEINWGWKNRYWDLDNSGQKQVKG